MNNLACAMYSLVCNSFIGKGNDFNFLANAVSVNFFNFFNSLRKNSYRSFFNIHSICRYSVSSDVQCSFTGVRSASFGHVRVFHTA